MKPMIVVENLTKKFGDFVAVEDVTFAAEEGKITALLGPSGSGKSTVLRIIAGLEEATSGRIEAAGTELTRLTVQERRVGFVFQHYALFRHMNVRENIAFGLSVRKESKAAQRSRVDELLQLVRLEAFADRYPSQLSGGQRQRVALARALAPKPRVLLLDEPFGALDASVRRDLRLWIQELHEELGITSLLVTHDQEEALELAHSVVILDHGRIEQVGTPSEVYNQPATPFVAGFVGAANVLEGLVIGGRVQSGDQLITGAGHLSDGSQASAYIRPHDVLVVRGSSNGASIQATVDRVVDLGWTSKVHLTLYDGQTVIAELPNDQILGLAVQDAVFVDLKNAKVFSPPDDGKSRSDELAVL
ncbi:MAG: sulfate/thiosulfate transport system ATP-binding protein [Actinomycetota bacterium]|nr:sulfate/thiosulfate transport system ATP-binding protein [Actinomycetota bacterium]